MSETGASVVEVEIRGVWRRGSKIVDVMTWWSKLAESMRESVNAAALLCEGGICCEGDGISSTKMRGIINW